MIKKTTVSTILSEVRANASFSTRKASTVTMEIDKRFSLEAYGLYLDRLDNIENKTGLIGFELVAVYEDGQAEPEKSPEELVIEEITDTLDEATAEETEETETEVEPEAEAEEQPELTETEEDGEDGND